MADIDSMFKQHYDEILGDRKQVRNLLQDLDKYESDALEFQIVEYTSFADMEDENEDYTDEEFDNLYKQEIPGYQLYVKSKHSKIDYKYFLFDILLPYQVEFPVEVTFNSLRHKKTFHFSDIKSMESYIGSVFESPEYKNIELKLNKLYE